MWRKASGLALALAIGATAQAQTTPPPAPAAGPPATAPAGPPAPAAEQRSPRGHGGLFVSPMGEPFRSNGAVPPQDMWFQQADTNHDNALSLAEFEADAARFFKVLDREHDGEIDPDDIEYYETVMLPEVRVGSSEADEAMSTESQGGGDDGSSAPRFVYPDRQGAGRYSYFDYPEPVTIADKNFNRGVDAEEFRQAADERFALLDANHDGVIQRSELPAFTPGAGGPSHEGSRRGHGGHGRGGGHHGGMGGMRGGGMGGMGGMPNE